jgi:hypothetical protein
VTECPRRDRSVGQPGAWRTIHSCTLPSTTSSDTASQCWQENTSIGWQYAALRVRLRCSSSRDQGRPAAGPLVAPAVAGGAMVACAVWSSLMLELRWSSLMTKWLAAWSSGMVSWLATVWSSLVTAT